MTTGKKSDLPEGWYDGLGLLELAAAHKGLPYKGTYSRDAINCTSPLKKYRLTDKLLAFLDERGICCEQNEKYTLLVDSNQQEKPPSGWANSNCWAFRELVVSLELELELGNDGVLLMPHTMGSAGGPTETLPQRRLFAALVEWDPKTPAVAKEIVAAGGSLLLSWSDLGLSGLLVLSDLFHEFTRGNQVVQLLAKRNCLFDPAPYPQGIHEPKRELYVTESLQAEIVETWRSQLEGYRDALVI